MKQGLLFFHQGWTDIFNSLGLIGWYLKTYDKLKVLIRIDAMPLLDCYCQQFGDRVELEYQPKELLDMKINFSMYSCDLLFHGVHNKFRVDCYKDRFVDTTHYNFVNTFYTLYDIPATARIDEFRIERDLELEDKNYNEFIKTYCTNYRLYHTIVPLPSDDPTLQTVDLNQSSDIFFDSIKILINAKELHLLDSSWASFVYLVDAKYRLFQHISVKIYCARKYIDIFSDPITLPNWTFHVVAENRGV